MDACLYGGICTGMQVQQGPEKGRSHGTGMTGVCESPYVGAGAWTLAVDKNSTLFTTEPPLPPQQVFYYHHFLNNVLLQLCVIANWIRYCMSSKGDLDYTRQICKLYANITQSHKRDLNIHSGYPTFLRYWGMASIQECYVDGKWHYHSRRKPPCSLAILSTLLH